MTTPPAIQAQLHHGIYSGAGMHCTANVMPGECESIWMLFYASPGCRGSAGESESMIDLFQPIHLITVAVTITMATTVIVIGHLRGWLRHQLMRLLVSVGVVWSARLSLPWQFQYWELAALVVIFAWWLHRLDGDRAAQHRFVFEDAFSTFEFEEIDNGQQQ